MAEPQEHIVTMNEGVRVQEVWSCLLCSTEGMLFYQSLRDRLFGAPGVWALMRCPKCGLVWLNPQPVPEDVGKLYENYFTHDLDIGARVPRSTGLRRAIKDAVLASCLGYNELNSSLLQKAVRKILSWVGPIREIVELSVMTLKRNPKGKLLDVGCGNGQFLAKMRDLGWEAIGVEPDRQAVKIARERFGLDVHEGTLEEIGFPDNTFDAITMNHVIEHVPNPLYVLRECRRVLKSNGILVITTPNLESLGYRVFRRRWRGLEVPRHFYLFLPYTLQMITERQGFVVKSLTTSARLARGILVASLFPGLEKCQNKPRARYILHLLGFGFRILEDLIRYLIAPNVGEELVLVAEKRDG